jgi:hypothetical protein
MVSLQWIEVQYSRAFLFHRPNLTENSENTNELCEHSTVITLWTDSEEQMSTAEKYDKLSRHQ